MLIFCSNGPAKSRKKPKMRNFSKKASQDRKMPKKIQKIGDKPTEKLKCQMKSKNAKFPQMLLRKTPSGYAGVWSGPLGCQVAVYRTH
jgi:hypothetical protein